MKNGIITILDRTEKLLNSSVIVIMIVMALVTFGQVVLRYVFKSPTIWSEELTRYLFVWLVLLTSAVAVRTNRHIKIDFLIKSLKPKLKLVLELITSALIIIFLVILLREGISIVQGTVDAKSASLKISMALPYLAIPTGAVLMIIFFLELTLRNIRSYLMEGKEGE
ncbi:C4-dicarboxylate transporter DctQ subunit [Sporosarcina luteola]|nr:C4-dicarboxylate transporter DctQ subunit [Sporosarcina luteola]